MTVTAVSIATAAWLGLTAPAISPVTPPTPVVTTVAVVPTPPPVVTFPRTGRGAGR